MINDVTTEYRTINGFIQRKLIEKCDREAISIDEVSFSKLRSKTFLSTKDVIYQSQHMLLEDLRA